MKLKDYHVFFFCQKQTKHACESPFGKSPRLQPFGVGISALLCYVMYILFCFMLTNLYYALQFVIAENCISVCCSVTLHGCHGPLLHMSSTMWYIMQSIQSKYSLSERLIRTIAAIRSFPHDNVEDLIRKVGLLISYLNFAQIISVSVISDCVLTLFTL